MSAILHQALMAAYPVAGGGGGGAGILSFISANSTPFYADASTSLSTNTPSGIQTNDGLFALVMTRSATTAPGGWTRVGNVSNPTTQGVSQFTEIWQKNSTSSADSSQTVIWQQASSARLGVTYFLIRKDTGFVITIEDSKTATGTSQIVLPSITGTANGQMVIYAASSTLGVSLWTVPYVTIRSGNLNNAAIDRLLGVSAPINSAQSLSGTLTTSGASDLAVVALLLG